MSMPRSAAAVVIAFMVGACGAVPGGHGDLAPPPAPTQALAYWNDFPVNAKPRPIIWFGDIAEELAPGQFPNEGQKESWVCRKFVLASGIKLSDTSSAAGSARWASGVTQAYSTTIGSQTALTAILAQPGGNSEMCSAARPFTIASATLGTATFATDRGEAAITAWVFDIPDAKGSVAYPALDPSAYWKGRPYPSESQGRGARVGADGKTLTIDLVGGPERGACGVDYVAAAAESEHAVAVAIKAYQHESNVACDLVGYERSVTLVLKAPLGNRVLVDENGSAGSASS